MTATIEIDGRRFRSILRDGFVQPNQDYSPLAPIIELEITSKSIQIRGSGTDSLVSKATYPFSICNSIQADDPIRAVIDYETAESMFSWLAQGRVTIEFNYFSGAEFAKSLTIRGKIRGAFQFSKPFTLDPSISSRMKNSLDMIERVKSQPTVVLTSHSDEFRKIRDAIKLSPFETFPVRIDDGSMRLELEWLNDSYGTIGVEGIWGDLEAFVEAEEDLHNQYPFELIRTANERINGEFSAYLSEESLVLEAKWNGGHVQYLIEATESKQPHHTNVGNKIPIISR